MEFVGEYAQHKDEILKRYELTDEELQAINNADIPKLYRMGVHPILIMGFSAAHGIGLGEHFSILKKAFGETTPQA